MKITLLSIITVFFSLSALATEPTRVLFASNDTSFDLEGFLYEPTDMTNTKGVVLVIGGSGFTRAGFGGPAMFSQRASDSGFIAFEWNKRGLTTNHDLTEIHKNLDVYKSATIDNIFADASAALDFIKNRYPTLPLFIVGGSEGSIVTTHLAAKYPKSIKAISTFGTVVAPFINIVEKQMADQIINTYWSKFDLDKNEFIDVQEFSNIQEDGEWAIFIENYSFTEIDVTADSKISRSELSRVLLLTFLSDEEKYTEHWLETSGIAPNYFEAIFSIESLYNRAKNIKVPALFVHGEEDWNTPVEDVYQLENLSAVMGYDHFQFKYYNSIGHAPSPEMLVDILEYFENIN